MNGDADQTRSGSSVRLDDVGFSAARTGVLISCGGDWNQLRRIRQPRDRNQEKLVLARTDVCGRLKLATLSSDDQWWTSRRRWIKASRNFSEAAAVRRELGFCWPYVDLDVEGVAGEGDADLHDLAAR